MRIQLLSSVALLVCASAAAVASLGEDGPFVPGPEQSTATAPHPGSPPPARELTRADAEAWLDGLIGYALPSGEIAGGVVVIVKDGEVVLQKGYGYADAAARTPVDAHDTLFRPGSVSKLFTWTAVMQLVEQGKLDLDADVNEYLDFAIPQRAGLPITLRNVLTHTPGFEEHVKDLMGVGEAPPADLGSYLARWVPERIFAPGQTPAYSNYATALAGHIVARVSGLTFDEYIEQHLFTPLGMERSTFRQPLPERLAPHMSKGYALASEPPHPFEIVGPAPAGSLSASGADMARFMIAHLQGGAYGAGRILAPETVELMHTSALTVLPRVNRMMLGFYETRYNGRRVIGHGGDTQWDLHLFIDDRIGLYMSFNSAGKAGAVGGLRSAIFEQFADRYLPGPAPEGEVDAATAARHARMIAGRYDNSRRMASSFMSLLNLVGEVTVRPNANGTISVSIMQSPGGVPLELREIEPFVWREVNGEHLLAAEAKDGRVVRFSFDDVSPFMMFEPTPAWRSGAWLLPLLAAGFGALLLTSLAWPVSALVRRHYRVPYPLAGREASAHRLLRIGALAVLALWTVWAATLAAMMSDYSLLSAETDGWVWLLTLLSPVVFIGGAAAGAWHAWVVMRSRRRWYAKAWSVALAVSLLAFLWAALVFELIALDVHY